MSGHIFIAEGDVRRVACDAWLLPTDVTGRVNRVWGDGMPDLAARIRSLRGDPQLRAGQRVIELPNDIDAGASSPSVWAVDSGGTGVEEAEWYADGVAAGLQQAIRGLPRRPRHGRDRHLVAMPLFGLGEGMGSGRAGQLVEAQIQAVAEISSETRKRVDFAVLASGPSKLAAAQQARRTALGLSVAKAWPELTSSERRGSERLGELARAGNLVLFIGAGVSSAAGLPGWSELLRSLAGETRLTRRDLDDLNPLDQARMIRRALGPDFAESIRGLFGGRREQSLSHQILASLPVTEAATTNYDTLFEEAWSFRGRDVAVLPRNQAALTEPRWLLKLHGTVEDPSSIVLTRDDYMRMDREGSALAGIVQALLITRRMLFVGYSLDDDRFHQIAHDARAAIGSRDERPASDPFGTALSPTGRRSVKELWEGEIDILDLGHGGSRSEGSRRIEIFLDCLLASSSDPAAYLDDPGFRALWSKDEVELAELLKQALAIASRPRAGPAAESVARHLREMMHRDSGKST